MGCGCNKGKNTQKQIDPKKGFVQSSTITSEGVIPARRVAEIEDTKPVMVNTGHPNAIGAIGEHSILSAEELEARLKPTPVSKPEPKKIGLLEKALSLGEALIAHVSDGLSKTTKKEFAARLSICESCHHRSEKNNCGLCGCVISTKAAWKTSTCPDDRWPELTEEKE